MFVLSRYCSCYDINSACPHQCPNTCLVTFYRIDQLSNQRSNRESRDGRMRQNTNSKHRARSMPPPRNRSHHRFWNLELNTYLLCRHSCRGGCDGGVSNLTSKLTLFDACRHNSFALFDCLCGNPKLRVPRNFFEVREHCWKALHFLGTQQPKGLFL